MLIGRRERFQNIRQVWQREIDFSDWLVTEDGMSFLSEELEIELENLTRESRPGNFPCDIVGNVLGDEDHIVVIENQYGKTDHDHLGKLLTYAAVHKAMTGIWIAERISDDHRQVIDWLNENTPTNINLYMVALELYRIGDSPVAPVLDIVCRPNNATKKQRSDLSAAERERRAWFEQTWEGIHDYVQSTNPPFRLQNTLYKNYSAISVGRSGFHLTMLLLTKHCSTGVELYIKVPWKESAFEQLMAQKSEIEREIGQQLDWQTMEGKIGGRILLASDIDPRDPANAEAVKKWLAEYSARMYQIFQPRVAALVEPNPEELEALNADRESPEEIEA